MLEGIGLIEKKSKNHVQWRPAAGAAGEEDGGEHAPLEAEVSQMQVAAAPRLA